jgi:hypothetical protein
MYRSNSTGRRRLALLYLFSVLVGLGAITSAKAQSPGKVDCKNEGMEVSDPSMIEVACYKGEITASRARETLTH